MKIVCIYHSIDLDGWMSAGIVKHWFKTTQIIKSDAIHTIAFIGYNYGQPIPDLSKYDRVIMVDISFPKEEMSRLWHSLDKDLIWIDHHISAIKDNHLYDNIPFYGGLQDTSFAACELTWKYFFPDETMPEIVRLLGRYDCFGHKGTDEEQKVLEFQYGARQVISNYEEAYNYLIKSLDYDIISAATSVSMEASPEDILLEDGKVIYQYLCTEAKQAYKNGFELEFLEPSIGDKQFGATTRKFIVINKERFNPINFGIDYHKEGYDGAACFHYDGKLWKWSLYNDNGKVDCSVIAKQFGGGGHKGAAGFVLTNDEFINLIH